MLNIVSSLSTADGLAIHDVFRARVCGALLTGSAGGSDSGSLLRTGFVLFAAAAAERATTPADSLVNVMSLSPNTARGQILCGTSGPEEATESVTSVEVEVLPLQLLLLPLLLPGEVELE